MELDNRTGAVEKGHVMFGRQIVPDILLEQYKSVEPLIEKLIIEHDLMKLTVRALKLELSKDSQNKDLVAIRRFQKNMTRHEQLEDVERKLKESDLDPKRRKRLLKHQRGLRSALSRH